MDTPKIDASNIQNLSNIVITGQGFVGSNTTNSYYFGSCNHKLRIAADAAFNSSGKDNYPICLPGTRLSVLARIRKWIDGDESGHIFWLHGLAGTGKSTIARTVARQLYDEGYWMASFFFARNDEKTGRANRFVSTIASQLSDKDLEFQQQLQDLILKDKGSRYRLLSDEWKELFINPLLCLKSPRSPLIIIIDALDECEGEGSITALIQILMQVQTLGQIKLRFLITSQSLSIIRKGLQQAGPTFVNFALQHVPDSEVRHDISLFLHGRLSVFNFGNEKIKKLVEKASGIFIWADTASRFLKTHRRIAFLRLTDILENCRADVPPEEHLNSLYLFVLQQSIDSSLESHHRKIMCQEIQIVLGSLVVLFAPLAFDPLARLIDQSVAKENLSDTLALFEPILDIPEDRLRPIRLHHPSFREFLLTAERCDDLHFRVDECHVHMAILKRSIELMSEFFGKDDVCDLKDPGALLSDLNPNDLQQRLPSELQYACSFWVQHLMKSKARILDDDFTHRFINTHLLHWFEALAWMEQMAEGISTLDLLTSATSSPLLLRLLQDAKRFMQYSQPVVSQAPLQIYLSAIIFAPEDSCVRQQFRESALKVALHLPMIQNSWGSLLYTFQFPGPVDVVAFMPGGAMAAIAVRNSILLWNLSTGRCFMKLEEHRSKVTSCIFSKNGKTLATSSCDHTVRLWEPTTGQIIHCFEGHTDIATTVIFSPDGTLLASASHDNTVRIWNISDGQLLGVLKDHTDSVHNLLFSADGKVLASSSTDGKIILWYFSSGEALQKFQLDGFTISMAFINGGTRLACIEDDGDQVLSLWNLANKNCEFQKRYGDDTCDMVLSLNGRWCAMYDNLDVLLYDLDDKTIVFRLLSGQENDVHAMAFSPDEKVLATGQEDGLLRIWDTTTAECSQIFVGRTGVRRIFFSQESDLMLSIHADNSLWLWDISSELQSGHENFEFASCDMEYIDLSPSMNVALSTAICSPVNLWDTKNGQHIAQLGKKSDSDLCYPYTFSPDGKLLASCSLDDDRIYR
ncbi:hypothetical protein N7507_009865 [Penicillium longicatenatum]|nr:hypothetical protein N7507_009865 [Penicillium longicatenatum]